jgi:UDP-2,4-diacetamido-2,4,6-trideoxy-beta-L-altropyranose hydrolase
MMRIVFRVDASEQIGIGHLMRCLTLAQSLSSRGALVHFICRHLSAYWQRKLTDLGYVVSVLPPHSDVVAVDDLAHARWLGVEQSRDAADTISVLGSSAWDWLVVDHYGLDHRWEATVRPRVGGLLVIDDLADRFHECDVLVDQNFYHDMQDRYAGKVPEACSLLLGTSYALLRPEFARLRSTVEHNIPGNRILICFGGVDAQNYTELAIEALASNRRRELHVSVIIGLQHPKRDHIRKLCASHGFECHVQVEDIASLMARSDLAIGAGGSTSWERCCLGLPTITFTLAENQRRVVEDAASEGMIYAPELSQLDGAALALHVEALLENPRLMRSIARRASAAVDGMGVQRVLRAMGLRKIQIRAARAGDSRTLFELRNHPAVRKVSHNSDPIDWSQHDAWFAGVLQSSHQALLVGEVNSIPIGSVRFDLQDQSAKISISVSPEHSESGLGSELLQAAEEWLAKNRPDVQLMFAEVLSGNIRSHRLFRAARYVETTSTYIKRVRS